MMPRNPPPATPIAGGGRYAVGVPVIGTGGLSAPRTVHRSEPRRPIAGHEKSAGLSERRLMRL
jgi:hypothetical protein